MWEAWLEYLIVGFGLYVGTCWITGPIYYWIADGYDPDDFICYLVWPIDLIITIYWWLDDKVHGRRKK